MAENAFNLLAKPIQRVLWDMKWRELRPIQSEAIHQVIEADHDIIISARTAAGKTEAAFLPVLSLMHQSPQPSVQALYVGPLKALINDQFRRLEDLCLRADIAVHRWHGDVPASKKKDLIKNPSGVLLITPESIESLFINQTAALSRVFQHTSFVVIDEIHALVGRERGTHLRSLLSRLRQRVNRDFRTIALSATLGNSLPIYAEWMRPREPETVRLITDEAEEKRVLFKVHGYVMAPPQESEGDEAPKERIVHDMYDHMAGSKNLVFANNKAMVEWFADSLNRQAKVKGRPNEFLVHHGSLSKELREFTEEKMQGNEPKTTVCSSTLELGIDIGNVASVGQIDPPWSVNSLVQRLGRSGRGENEPQQMRIYVRLAKSDEKTKLVKRLHPDLVRTIALTLLMLEKPQWVEPPQVASLDFSTMSHQILSILAETGGILTKGLYARLVTNGAFGELDQKLFVDLLRGLAEKELIEQMPQGELILAPEGEAITNHYSFYSAFASPIEYVVLHGGRRIGMLPGLYVPNPGDCFILGGRRWKTVAVDDDRREVMVQPTRGRKAPKFTSAGGEIHQRVRETMFRILNDSRDYPFLDETATKFLADARSEFAKHGLANNDFIPTSDNSCLCFTWTGTSIQRTICMMASTIGLDATDEEIAIGFHDSAAVVRKRLSELLNHRHDARKLASQIAVKQLRKYDEHVPDSLLVESLARDALDVPAALKKIASLCSV